MREGVEYDRPCQIVTELKTRELLTKGKEHELRQRSARALITRCSSIY